MEEEEAQYLEAADQALMVCAVLAVEGMTVVLGLALEEKGFIVVRAVELVYIDPEVGLENPALKEGGLLEGGVSVLPLEVAPVFLQMFLPCNIYFAKCVNGMGRRHSLLY